MVSEFIQRQKNDLVREVSALGSLFFYVLVVLVFLILGNREMFSMLLAGLAVMYAITILLRTVYFRERPDSYNYNSYIEKLDAASFPSLHASRAVFMGSLLINYFNSSLMSLVLVVLVLAILYSRISLKKHDWKDLLAGAVVGIAAYFGVDYIL